MTKKQQAARDEQLLAIARKHLVTIENRADLEPHRTDDDDFFEVSIWGLRAALEAAYEAGLKAGK